MTAYAIEDFGVSKDGEAVQRVRLEEGGLTAHVITWGAVLQDLRLEGHDAPLVCGFDTFQPYPEHSPHFGATPGRVANRIGNARFTLDGTEHHLDANKGAHILHGGANGFSHRVWTIADVGHAHVDLHLVDPDGTAGFPGTVEATCSYTLKAGGVLHIALTTRTDAPTITNLTHHSYFDLEGNGDIRDHIVTIHADAVLPVDADFIPTGPPVPVADTGRDFRKPRTIADALAQLEEDGAGVLDHNWCLADHQRGLQDVATVTAPTSGVAMTLATTEPGVQFYAGHKVTTPVAGLSGTPYGAFAGLCLEPQIWP
ncbi:galactose mutarotase, partial [Rhizobiaceae bacterium]|nr:galactose mutarotase [Rhizobiaceae bacterium]